MELRNKTVLVTGAAKRIGREMALAFARKGCRLVIHHNRSHREARAFLKELQSLGVEALSYRADLLKIQDIRKLCQTICREVGTVDILINNASVFYPTPFEKISEKDWDVFLGLHVKAPFFLAQGLAPAMKKGGRVVNIADWSGLRPYKNYLPYCVSKGALITLTQALAKAMAPRVLVTALCPGPVLPPPEMKRSIINETVRKTLVGRWGKPEDVARFAVFLAEQDFVTGSVHMVDGGELLRS